MSMQRSNIMIGDWGSKERTACPQHKICLLHIKMKFSIERGETIWYNIYYACWVTRICIFKILISTDHQVQWEMHAGRPGLVDSAQLDDASKLLPTSLRIQLYHRHGEQTAHCQIWIVKGCRYIIWSVVKFLHSAALTGGSWGSRFGFWSQNHPQNLKPR